MSFRKLVKAGFAQRRKTLSNALLAANPRPDESEIRESNAGNLCRCTGYQRIVESIRHAAKGQASREPG